MRRGSSSASHAEGPLKGVLGEYLDFEKGRISEVANRTIHVKQLQYHSHSQIDPNGTFSLLVLSLSCLLSHSFLT